MKQIPGFERYTISESGEVISYVRGRPKIIKGNMIKGYMSVGLRDINAKRVHLKRHRLVAMVYISNPNNHPVVNHLDGNKFNNHYSNLEWTTEKENSAHAASIGKYKWTSRAVIDTKTGKVYNTITEAAKSTGRWSECYVGKMLKGDHPNKTNFIYAC